MRGQTMSSFCLEAPPNNHQVLVKIGVIFCLVVDVTGVYRLFCAIFNQLETIKSRAQKFSFSETNLFNLYSFVNWLRSAAFGHIWPDTLSSNLSSSLFTSKHIIENIGGHYAIF